MHEEQKERKQEVRKKCDWPAHRIIMTSGRWNREAEEQRPNQPAAERLLS